MDLKTLKNYLQIRNEIYKENLVASFVSQAFKVFAAQGY
jgi:hypothetical protein